MYLLSSLATKRIRLALGFNQKIIDGSNRSEVTWVLSDSGQQYFPFSLLLLLIKVARRKEEELKLMTLFKSNYRPARDTLFECAFDIIHPNLTFIFDDPVRGPNGLPCSFKIIAHILTEAQNTTTFWLPLHGRESSDLMSCTFIGFVRLDKFIWFTDV